MAGMFYSLKETAAKLGVSEQEVRQMSRDGRLREFRDGTNVLFKIDEVEALAKELAQSRPQEPAAEEPTEELVVEQEPSAEGLGREELESLFATESEPEVPDQTEGQVPPADEDLLLAEQAAAEEPPAEAAPDLSDTLGMAAPEASNMDEVFLAPESGTAKDDAALDTTITGEGVKVEGQTGEGDKLIDDTLAETMAGLGAGGESSEASLEEIEKDVNLDTFGSGSGLLDLSLQADDTSLGGVLDEIYTPGEQKEATAEDGGKVVAEMEAGPEPIPAGPDLTVAVAPVPQMAIPVPLEQDPAEGLVGALLGLSLVVAAYTLVTTVSAHLFQTTPGLVEMTKAFIVYAIGGLAVVALALSAMVFLKGRGLAKAAGPRPKKEKKPKKGKKAKAAQ